MTHLPSQFVSRLRQLGLKETDRLIEALENSEPTVSVRPNGSRPWLPPGVADEVPWLTSARYLDDRPLFTLMPELHQGRFYVQDASSMFVATVLRQLFDCSGRPVTMLDACAAPGGKTTAAIDALPPGSLVVANEFDYRRASVLHENVVKWGYPSVVVSRGDTSRFRKLQSVFDVIAVDAPCSGEGMFRKEEVAVSQWSEALVTECADCQREILDNVWKSLKPGGYLIYSTCTFNRDENEDMVSWLLENHEAESVEIKTGQSWGVVLSPLTDNGIYAYRFMPGVVRGEGLFMSVLRKAGDLPAAADRPDRKREKKDRELSEAAGWLAETDLFDIRRDGDTIEAVPSLHRKTVALLDRYLDVVSRGVTLATVKGRDLIPDHALAMSSALRRGSFPEVEIDLRSALAYLRCEAIQLPEDTPRGFVIVTYGGYPLGFMKNLGNRANNLYRREWRILKQG